MYLMSSAVTTSRHQPEDVFALWADPVSWPTWDPEVRRVEFSGPMRLGASGTLWPAKGPKTVFTVTVFQACERLVDITRLPGATVSFDHRITKTAQGSELTVRVELTGPAAPLWKRVLAPGLRDAADAGLRGLIAHLDTVSAS